MLSYLDAAQKFRQIDPRIPRDVEELGQKILHREAVLTPENHDDNPSAKALLHWIEHRLAQPHLGFLAPDQVNEIWGGSTTVALKALGERYDLRLDPVHPMIGADFMRAILDGSKSNEEPLPKQNSYGWLQAQVERADHVWVSGAMEFNVIGIRGYMVPQGVVANTGNLWNDTIFLAWKDRAGQAHVKSWAASTDPGVWYYTVHANPRGCAHLMPGQYKYGPGLHNGHPAFIQAGNVTVARTNAANYTDRSRVETDSPAGRFWIDNHAGFAFWDQQGVDNSSAGCQVIKGAGWKDWRWLDYHQTLIQEARGWHWYTLLEGPQLAH